MKIAPVAPTPEEIEEIVVRAAEECRRVLDTLDYYEGTKRRDYYIARAIHDVLAKVGVV